MNYTYICIIALLVIFLLSCNDMYQYYEYKKKKYYTNYFKFNLIGLNTNIAISIFCLVIIFMLI